MPNDNKKEDI